MEVIIMTQFIDVTDGAWIKGVPCLVPNLQEGQYVLTMDGPEKDYRKWRYRIDNIETIVASRNSVLQNVYLALVGKEDQWQEMMGRRNKGTTI